MKALAFCLAVCVVVLSWPDRASAHSLAIRKLDDAKAITVDFYYADGSAMAYGEVRIFAPDVPDVPYMNGRSDRLGRFAFVPSQPGIWRVDAKDAEGHATTLTVEIGETDATPSKWRQPRLWLLVGSLTVNLAFLAYWLGRRRQRPI